MFTKKERKVLRVSVFLLTIILLLVGLKELKQEANETEFYRPLATFELPALEEIEKVYSVDRGLTELIDGGRIDDPTTTTPPTKSTTAPTKKKVKKATATKETIKETKKISPPKPNPSGKFLFSISNPDLNYQGVIMEVEDRTNLEGLVMAEFGTSYEGMVLVAQAIRDTMLKTGIRNTLIIKKKFGYTPPIRKKVSEACRRAVAFVFDEGGSGVQHPIHVFYATKYAKGKWHNTQKFIIEYAHVRFFAMWRYLD